MTNLKAKHSKHRIHRSVTALLMTMVLSGCAAPSFVFGETVGEKFRSALANVDAVCKERKIGPYLDPSDPDYRRKSALTNCEVLKVRPFDLNAVLATPEGKFAYSIKLPAPLDKPRVRRTDYRSAEDYFQALCEREGSTISYKKSAIGEGIVFLRAPIVTGRYTLSSFSEESAIGNIPPNPEELLLLRPNSPFKFVERLLNNKENQQFPNSKYLRFVRDSSDPKKLQSTPIETPSALYGYVFRGTEILNDREAGIFGGEAILVDLTTGDVMGAWRGFGRDSVDTSIKDRVRYFGTACKNAGGRSYSDFILNWTRAEVKNER